MSKKIDLPFAPKAWPAVNAKLWKLGDIKPHPENPKKHPQEQIDLLAKLMLDYGVDQPIVVDDKGVILKGHGRRLAAMKAGFEEFPVAQHFGLTDAEKRAMRIADNQLPLLGGWDNELMKLNVSAIQLAKYDMKLLGFGDRQLLQWTASPGTAAEKETLPPSITDPIVRAGDLWKLGKHLLLCGDSTKADAVRSVIKGRTATMLTDPPYGIGYEYREHNDTKAGNADLVAAVFGNAPGAKIWTPGKMNLARELTRYPDAKVLMWHKKFAQAGNGLGGASTFEPVLVTGISNGKLPDDYLSFPTDREASPVDGERMLRDEHPCPKPVALFEHLAVCLIPADRLIFEPFSGSGTTLIAAETTGRLFAGIEIDPAYVELAIRRWQALTKRDAMLDGKTFDKVAADRKKPQPRKAGASSGRRR